MGKSSTMNIYYIYNKSSHKTDNEIRSMMKIENINRSAIDVSELCNVWYLVIPTILHTLPYREFRRWNTIKKCVNLGDETLFKMCKLNDLFYFINTEFGTFNRK